jgi:hypothetical protein
MLFMVIEQFKPGRIAAIGERFQRAGRMLPEGVTYHASWVDPSAARCFQIMEAAHLELLQSWARQWDDLVDFEFVPVLASADFWARVRTEESRSGPCEHRSIE